MKGSTSQGILFDNSTKMLNDIFCKCTVKPVNKDYQEKLAKWSYMCIEHSSSWQNIVISEVRQYISSVKQVVLVQVWLSILHVYTYCLLMVTNSEKRCVPYVQLCLLIFEKTFLFGEMMSLHYSWYFLIFTHETGHGIVFHFVS